MPAGLNWQVDVPRYYMGVIDMLQDWNMSKRIERLAKIVLKVARLYTVTYR